MIERKPRYKSSTTETGPWAHVLGPCSRVLYQKCCEVLGPWDRGLWEHQQIDRRLGGRAQRPNREIVSFRSCARAVLDVRWKCSSNVAPRVFPFAFCPREAFPFPLRTPPSPQPPIQL